MRALKIAGFWLLSLTWGCMMTIIGLLVALIMLCTGHRPHVFGYGFYFVVGKHWGGCELGVVFLVNKSPSLALLQHEAGHGVQNIIFGVLMPLIVASRPRFGIGGVGGTRRAVIITPKRRSRRMTRYGSRDKRPASARDYFPTGKQKK